MKLLKLLKKTTTEWVKNDVSVYAASISYYTLFSVGPLITILIWALGYFFEREAVNGQIYELLRSMTNENVAKLVQSIVIKAGEQIVSGIWATLFGLAITIYSAIYIVVQMKEVLDKVWKISHVEKTATLAKKYIIGLAGIFGIGLILLFSGLMSAIVALLSHHFFVILPFTEFLIRAANNLVVFISVAIFISAMFKYLPNQRLKWKAIIPGALFTTTVFFVGKIFFNWYMSTQMLDSTYGAASSIVVFMMWIYFSAQVVFFGAEFTKMYALDRGLIVQPKSK